MLLDRSIAIRNMLSNTIHFNFNVMNGLLRCSFVWLINYLINYLSIIKIIFDIVSRAVNAFKDKYPPPQLEQINTTIKHNRISLFDNVSSKKDGNVMIAVISQNASSAVHFVMQKISQGIKLLKLDCEVNYV